MPQRKRRGWSFRERHSKKPELETRYTPSAAAAACDLGAAGKTPSADL